MGGGASLFYAERGARSIYAHHMALLVSADGIRCRTAATSSAKTAPSWALCFPPSDEIWTIVTLTLVIYTRSVPCVAARSNRALPASAAGAAQRYPSAQPLAWPRALTHGLACSHAQRRAARPRVAPAPQRPRHSIALITPAPSTALGADAREPTLVAARRRSISRHSSRATRPPAFLRRLPPETSRHRTREPRDHIAPSACRIFTRHRLAGGVRRTGRPSVRGAVPASARGAISAQVPPSSPRRHASSTR